MSKFKTLNLSLLVSVAMLNIGNMHASAAADDEQPRAPTASSASSSSSSASDVTQFEMFQKIRSLDELPALLDKAIAHYGTELTPVVFLDFDDCSAQRRYILNILGTTYQFDWISSAERMRQLVPITSYCC